MAEAEDLKSFKCGFDPHSRYVDKPLEDQLTEAIDVMSKTTFDLHHYFADNLENPIVHRQVIGLLQSDMPKAHKALLALMGAVEEVKRIDFMLRHPTGG